MERNDTVVSVREPSSIARFLRELNPRILDALLALVLTATALLTLVGRSGSNPGPFERDDTLGLVLVLGQTIPLAFRRAAPLAVLCAISLAVVSHSALGYAQVQAGTFGSLIALYTVASLRPFPESLVGAFISWASVAAFFVTNRGVWDWSVMTSTAATWAVAWFAGIFVRLRAQQVEAAGVRVARLEREQEVKAREAVADERARMARELHDIVGHSLNLIVIQAGGARRVFDTRPEIPREALASIEATARESLFDMERMLGVMRESSDADVASGPQPSLDELQALADHVSEAGIEVEITSEGTVQELPASLALSAYRIVQESLTNCLKHSGAKTAMVKVCYLPDALEVEIIDDGLGAAAPARDGGGRGHLGMRERVSVFGGDLNVGPVPNGRGYRVHVRLPYRTVER